MFLVIGLTGKDMTMPHGQIGQGQEKGTGNRNVSGMELCLVLGWRRRGQGIGVW